LRERLAESIKQEANHLRSVMANTSVEEVKDKVGAFVHDLIDCSSLDLRADVELLDDESIEVTFKGFDLPLLLGHNAELLDAMQYITRRAFAREVAEGLQIDFDAQGYRSQRRHELELMALKAADRVKSSRVPFVFDPMSAQDRRIIHMAVVNDPGVRTESEGEGQMRRVKIVPA
jgi:spoIIIJ-associated protein